MRSLLIASAGLALAGGATADAQTRPGASYGVPGVAMQAPMARPNRPGPIAARPPVVHTSRQQVGGPRAPRWGSKIGGRWWGGANAPGGWAGYRRPHRGWAVPGYWNAPRFYVSDWSNYGLAQPPQGYNWARYYDDAVLIDSRGSVYDTTNGVDWDRPDAGGYRDGDIAARDARVGYPGDYAREDAVYASPNDRPYSPPLEERRYREDVRPVRDTRPVRDNGLGGAAIGAVAGGVAGNLIAGRGNRLGGTLIGAGIGAGAGYAIDRAEDRGRRGNSRAYNGYGAGYAPPPRGYDAGYGSPQAAYAPPSGGSWVSPDGMATVTTTNGTVYPTGSTTVVVQSAPMVTTTTTTEYYDRVSYAPRKVWRKRARAKPVCNCR